MISDALRSGVETTLQRIERSEYIGEDEYLEVLAMLSAHPDYAAHAKTTHYIAFRRHERSQCPACGTQGWFRWHLWGQMRHAPCAMTWYAPPLQYLAHSWKAAWRSGAMAGADIASDGGKEERGGSTLAFLVWAFFIGYFSLGFRVLLGFPCNLAMHLLRLGRSSTPTAVSPESGGADRSLPTSIRSRGQLLTLVVLGAGVAVTLGAWLIWNHSDLPVQLVERDLEKVEQALDRGLVDEAERRLSRIEGRPIMENVPMSFTRAVSHARARLTELQTEGFKGYPQMRGVIKEYLPGNSLWTLSLVSGAMTRDFYGRCDVPGGNGTMVVVTYDPKQCGQDNCWAVKVEAVDSQ